MCRIIFDTRFSFTTNMSFEPNSSGFGVRNGHSASVLLIISDSWTLSVDHSECAGS
jgi:hypothetical protein